MDVSRVEGVGKECVCVEGGGVLTILYSIDTAML